MQEAHTPRHDKLVVSLFCTGYGLHQYLASDGPNQSQKSKHYLFSNIITSIVKALEYNNFIEILFLQLCD